MLDTITIDELHGAPLEVAVDVTPESLGLSDETFRFIQNIGGKLTFRLIGHDVSAHGQLSVVAVAPCVRCLEPARCELTVPVNEVWFREDPEADKKQGKARRRKPPIPAEAEAEGDLEEENSFKGDELDPRETLRELIMSDLPDLPKCREDCKGICPSCGANRNTEPCDCKPEGLEEDAGGAPGNAEDPTEAPGADTTPEPEWKRAMRELREKVED